MPFYEYQCKNCGHELEAMQKVSEPPLKKCPHCGKAQLQRLMSAPVFRLKGKGWYETDFKGDGDNKRNLADKPEADAPKEVESKTSDAKPVGQADVKSDASGNDKPKDKVEKTPEKAPSKAETKKIDLKRGKQRSKKPSVKLKKKSR